jgi:hypothetical protein
MIQMSLRVTGWKGFDCPHIILVLRRVVSANRLVLSFNDVSPVDFLPLRHQVHFRIDADGVDFQRALGIERRGALQK